MNKLQYLWSDRKYLLGKKAHRLFLSFVWCLPDKLVYWCAIRVLAHATTGKYRNQSVPELTAMEALERWENGKFR